MKLHFLFKQLLSITTILIVVSACSKKNTITPNQPNPVAPIKAGFVNELIQVTESSSPIATQIQLTAASSREEKVVLKLSPQTAQYDVDFSTIPAAVNGLIELSVPRGSREVTIQIVPVNNRIKNGERVVALEIDAQKTTIGVDTKSSARLQIVDDETAALIGFAQNTGKVNESSNQHKEVILQISPVAVSDGYVDIAFNAPHGTYGTHFTTSPELQNGYIRVPVRMGETSIRFYVKPINDQQIQPNRIIRFGVANINGALETGTNNLYTLTIEEDDQHTATQTKIASLRNNYSGTPMYLFNDLTIEGTITSVKDNIESTVAYVEDETGGIAIHFSAPHTLRPGEVVSIQLQQGTAIRERNGALEISTVQMSDVQVFGWDFTIAKTFTLNELYQGANKEGLLVNLSDVRFTEANGQLSLYGDRIISDGQKTAIVRTHAFASFRNQVIPSHKVNITGILVYDQGTYIIMPLTGSSIR